MIEIVHKRFVSFVLKSIQLIIHYHSHPSLFPIYLSLTHSQDALVGNSKNFPIPGIGPIMRAISFPFGQPYQGSDDAMTKRASDLITRPSGIRTLLSEGVFISNDPNDRMRMLNDILPQSIAADKIVSCSPLFFFASFFFYHFVV